MNWNERCAEAIRKEKAEIQKRYKIRFAQTAIFCSQRGKSISDPKLHPSTKALRSQYEPDPLLSFEARARVIDSWRERTGILPGETKDQALEKFRFFREQSRTCERCSGDDSIRLFCDGRLICMEIEERKEIEDESGGEVDIGGRPYEELRLEEAGIG